MPHSLGELKLLWPQSAGELLSFANYLERNNAGITAEQIRMAVEMGNAYLSLVAPEEDLVKQIGEGESQ